MPCSYAAAFAVGGSCEVTRLDRASDADALLSPGERTGLSSHHVWFQAQLCWQLHNATLNPAAPELAISLSSCGWRCRQHHHHQRQRRHSIFTWQSQLPSITKNTPDLFTSQSPSFLGFCPRGKGERSSFLIDPETVCISCPRIYLFPRWLMLVISSPWAPCCNKWKTVWCWDISPNLDFTIICGHPVTHIWFRKCE